MTLSAAMETEVAFISGVSATGTLAAQSFATWTGGAPATYGATSFQDKWGTLRAGTAGGTVTYAFSASSNFTAAEKAVIVAGLTLWSDETNIHFTLATSQSAANALFTRSPAGAGSDESNARTGAAVGSATLGHVVGQATIALGDEVLLDGTMAQDSYGIGAVIHEEGHLIGLGHAGAYDEGAASNAPLTADDTDQYSIMSYNTQPAGTDWGSTVVATSTDAATGVTTTTSMPNLPTTPMMLDILAAQRLYGAPTASALSGGQTFGFNCNVADASKMFFDFTQNTSPVVTLFDTGLNNTLDLSGFSAGAVIDLAEGAFTSCNGQTGNVGIALGTVIGTAIGGAGNDFFYIDGSTGVEHFDGRGGVNFVGTATAAGSGTVAVDLAAGTMARGGTLDATFANVLGLQLGAGAASVAGLTGGTDLIYGGTGALAFTGQGATDYIQASSGTNTIVGGHGNEIVFANGGTDVVQGGSAANFLQAGATAASSDTFTGTGGADFVYGGAGTTHLIAGSGTELLSGGAGTSILEGGTGLDILVGGRGTDVFNGGSGTSLMFEATGTDTFTGGSGTDYVYGGAGTSNVTGGSGTDVLTTGAGNQTLTAGTGLTVFNDTAAHLTAGRFDQIDNVSGGRGTSIYMPASVAAATHFAAQAGGTAILTTVGAGHATILVAGASLATVVANTHFTL